MISPENTQGIADHIAFAVFLAVSEGKFTREQWLGFCGQVYDALIKTSTTIAKEYSTNG